MTFALLPTLDGKSSGGHCGGIISVGKSVQMIASLISVADTERLSTRSLRAGGLLSRAIQHEWDHLQGILFIDRMEKKIKEELKPDLEVLQFETKAELAAAKK